MYSHRNTKGILYHLNSKELTLRGGKMQRIYYFSKDARSETATAFPEGMMVKENARTGFLVLSKIK